MLNSFLSALLLVGLAACQSASQPATAPAASAPSAATPSATTPEAARAAVARYLQGQPNAALYVLDSASVVDDNAHWQVMVPRTDWAKRMPNAAAFEVNKTTGVVSVLPVR